MKKIIPFFLALIIVFSLAACSSGNEEKVIDMVALGNHVTQNVKFSEKLEQIDSEYALSLYGLDSVNATAVAYSGTAAVAEAFTVFQAANESDVAIIQSAVESRIDYLSESYASYGPAEVPKIESAVVITEGNYVIFCISADNAAAKQIIEDFIH